MGWRNKKRWSGCSLKIQDGHMVNVVQRTLYLATSLPVSQFILPPGQVAPRGATQPWTGCPPGGNMSRDILPPTLVIFTPGGRHIPAGLSCPPGVKINQPGYLAPHPWFWSSNCPEILKLLLISQACINGIFHIIQIRLLVVTLTNFLENSPFLGGPHPAFWSSN